MSGSPPVTYWEPSTLAQLTLLHTDGPSLRYTALSLTAYLKSYFRTFALQRNYIPLFRDCTTTRSILIYNSEDTVGYQPVKWCTNVVSNVRIRKGQVPPVDTDPPSRYVQHDPVRN